ncbi:hypothetical protein [Sorangium sp. So ce1000]|uniref:hypothetical protein n=1 Tax=Sorangium sp. So ce1000 TaxID=3133325 RepID=UPI003F61CD59
MVACSDGIGARAGSGAAGAAAPKPGLANPGGAAGGGGWPACSDGIGARAGSGAAGAAAPKPVLANPGGAAGGGGCAALAPIRSVVGAGWKAAWLEGTGSDCGGAEMNGSALGEKTPLADSTSCCETSPGGRVPPRAETAAVGGWVYPAGTAPENAGADDAGPENAGGDGMGPENAGADGAGPENAGGLCC